MSKLPKPELAAADSYRECPMYRDTGACFCSVGIMHGPCGLISGSTMHRHPEWVNHMDADHDHGACSDHAHWAGGFHRSGTPLEVEGP